MKHTLWLMLCFVLGMVSLALGVWLFGEIAIAAYIAVKDRDPFLVAIVALFACVGSGALAIWVFNEKVMA